MERTLFDIEPEPTADDGLPTLTGSPKQVPWALKIRTELMAGVHQLVRQQRRLVELHQQAERVGQYETAKAALSRMIEAAGRLERETTSRFWIDRRELTPEQLLRGVNPQDVEGADTEGDGRAYR